MSSSFRSFLAPHLRSAMALAIVGVMGVGLGLGIMSPKQTSSSATGTAGSWRFSLQMDDTGLALQAVSGLLNLNVVANDDQRVFDLRVSDKTSPEERRGAAAVAVAD